MIEIYNSNNNERKMFSSREEVSSYIKKSLKLEKDVPHEFIESGQLNILARHPMFITMLKTKEEILGTLKRICQEDVDALVNKYEYSWDENESTSRNLRNLAECMFNNNNKE